MSIIFFSLYFYSKENSDLKKKLQLSETQIAGNVFLAPIAVQEEVVLFGNNSQQEVSSVSNAGTAQTNEPNPHPLSPDENPVLPAVSGIVAIALPWFPYLPILDRHSQRVLLVLSVKLSLSLPILRQHIAHLINIKKLQIFLNYLAYMQAI